MLTSACARDPSTRADWCESLAWVPDVCLCLWRAMQAYSYGLSSEALQARRADKAASGLQLCPRRVRGSPVGGRSTQRRGALRCHSIPLPLRAPGLVPQVKR